MRPGCDGTDRHPVCVGCIGAALREPAHLCGSCVHSLDALSRIELNDDRRSISEMAATRSAAIDAFLQGAPAPTDTEAHDRDWNSYLQRIQGQVPIESAQQTQGA